MTIGVGDETVATHGRWLVLYTTVYAHLPAIPFDFPDYLIPQHLDGKLRLRLWLHQNGKCHWCSIDTLLVEKNFKGGLLPHHSTLDHMYSKYELDNRQKNRDVFVMACNKCNGERGKRAEQQVGIEELRRRSGYYDPNHRSKRVRKT